jgi:hypothetical protein
MKWVTDYNNDSIKHLSFVLHGGKNWAHWDVICLESSMVLPMTEIAFTHALQLLKAKCKREFLFTLNLPQMFS